jgi:hypothetical protein
VRRFIAIAYVAIRLALDLANDTERAVAYSRSVHHNAHMEGPVHTNFLEHIVLVVLGHDEVVLLRKRHATIG